MKLDGGPAVIRTRDLRFRKPLLYPSELQGHIAYPLCYNMLSGIMIWSHATCDVICLSPRPFHAAVVALRENFTNAVLVLVWCVSVIAIPEGVIRSKVGGRVYKGDQCRL
jgi:hypothetical protein